MYILIGMFTRCHAGSKASKQFIKIENREGSEFTVKDVTRLSCAVIYVFA
jgi:hypothetical protein